MATEYTHKKVEGDFEIYRNKEHVATFDPVTEDVTYTNGNDKYNGPVGRVVVKILAEQGASTPEVTPEVTPTTRPLGVVPKVETNTEVNRLAGELYEGYCRDVGGVAFNGDPLPSWGEFSTDPEKTKQADAWRGVGAGALKAIQKREKFIKSLEAEVNDLKQQLRGESINRVPDRYKGVNLNDPTAPVQDPRQGDLTPEFIAWARGGGMSKEHFLQVYTDRIKDLTYPTPSPEEAAE